MYSNSSQEETIGHIEGMLNRDLRTTKSYFKSARTRKECNHRNVTSADCRISNTELSHVFVRKNKHFQHRRNAYAWNSLQRFKHILILGVYLLSIFNLPRSLSKPIPTMEEFWIFSEKIDTENKDSICNFVKNMQQQANTVKVYGIFYKNKYRLEDCKTLTLDAFFPNVNSDSRASDEIDGSQFDALDLNEFIKNAFHYLQKFSIGLERIHQHQIQTNSNITEETKKEKFHLRSLLYELHRYVSSYEITLFPDVKFDDLPEVYKPTMDDTKFMIFSCLLVRQYVNTLNYVHAGLSHYNQTDCKS